MQTCYMPATSECSGKKLEGASTQQLVPCERHVVLAASAWRHALVAGERSGNGGIYTDENHVAHHAHAATIGAYSM